MQMLCVLSPLVQGLIGWLTNNDHGDNDNDDNDSSALHTRNALCLRKALAEAIRFLVQPEPRNSKQMPPKLMMDLSNACSAEFHGKSQCCVNDFYHNIMEILSAGLSGMHSNFAVQFNFRFLITLS
jgi:hypothetical protein